MKRSMMLFVWGCAGLAVGQTEEDPMLQAVFQVVSTILSGEELSIEDINQAPAPIVIRDVEESQLQGLTEVSEILTSVPGVFVARNPFGFPSASIRTIPSLYNNRTLFMLDGVPMWGVLAGRTPFQGIPLNSIERIEIIRFPAALFYGTNATNGIVNVVTKSKPNNSISLQGGRFGHARLGFSMGTRLGASSLRVFGEVIEEDGETIQYETRFPGQVDPIRDRARQPFKTRSLLGTIEGDSWGIIFSAFRFETRGIRSDFTPPDSLNFYRTPHEGGLVHFKKTWREKNKKKIQIYADLNWVVETDEIKNFFAPGVDSVLSLARPEDSFRFRVGGRLNQEINKRLDFFGGVEAERRSVSELQLLLPNGANQAVGNRNEVVEYGAYGQLNWRLNDSLQVLPGMRMVSNEDAGEEVITQLLALYRPSPNWTLKGIYSEGFTTPTEVSKNINVPGVVIGNPTRRAETTQIVEMELGRQVGKWRSSLGAYRIQFNDLQIGVTRNGVVYYINSSESLFTTGVEMAVGYSSRGFKLENNLTYQVDGDTVLDRSPWTATAPKWTNFMGILNRKARFSWGLSLHSIGATATTESLHLVNANVTLGNFGSLRWAVTGKNLLGEKLLFPNRAVNTSISPVVANDGEARKFSLELTYKWK